MKKRTVCLLLLCILLAGCSARTAQPAETSAPMIKNEATSAPLPSQPPKTGFRIETEGNTALVAGYYGKNVVVPDQIKGKKVTVIGREAFSQCLDIVTLTLPSGIETIEENAFAFCEALKSFTIPEAVTSIDGNPFYGCCSLPQITVEKGNRFFQSIDGVLYSKDGTMLIAYPEAKKGKEFAVPDSVLKIGKAGFGYHGDLKRVKIPQTVTDFPDENLFLYMTDVVLEVKAGSAAENYAKAYNLEYEVSDF